MTRGGRTQGFLVFQGQQCSSPYNDLESIKARKCIDTQELLGTISQECTRRCNKEC